MIPLGVYYSVEYRRGVDCIGSSDLDHQFRTLAWSMAPSKYEILGTISLLQQEGFVEFPPPFFFLDFSRQGFSI